MSQAAITWISGPVLKARVKEPFQINEAILVGERQLLGEVVRLHGRELTAQVFEDTSGLRPGDLVKGQNSLLAVPLGPGLLGGIYDGLLRPLSRLGGDFIHPGARYATAQHLPFTPKLKPGQHLLPGHPFGEVRRFPAPSRPQLCLAPPTMGGEVESIAPEGEYEEKQVVCQVRDAEGRLRELTMGHPWPVRTPRPVKSRLPIGPPLLTGQRILDSIFPVARGGRGAVPGGFGTGKTVLLSTVAKWCNADVIIYVGCGERGNEMAGMLEEFTHLEDPRTGRPLMERTVVIANTSNMPVAAREASIYTGVTVGEYFRDQGLHVALMADSTSRWAEALREVSGRLGELPGEGGYPAYLGMRLAEFYERAALVRTLGGSEGSLTIMGTVSPPSSDFSEPVTIHTKRYVRNFWVLDRKRAQARFFPAIDPLQSFSEDANALAAWWHRQGNPRWADERRRFLTLLEEHHRLERMVRIVGKESLPPKQQLTLLCAELVNEAFLRQSAFAENDRFASPERQTRMMAVLGRFIDHAERGVGCGMPVERIANMPVFRRLQRMGEEVAEADMEAAFQALEGEIDAAFNLVCALSGIGEQESGNREKASHRPEESR